MTSHKQQNEVTVATVLRRVFLEDSSSVSPSEMQAVVAMASQIPNAVLSQLLTALEGKFRRQIVMALPRSRQTWWLETSPDSQDLGFVFDAWPKEAQSALLADWFVTHRDRYLLIKESANQRTIALGDIWVRTDTALPDVIHAEVERVLDAIQNAGTSPSAFSDFLAPRATMYAPEVLESIGKSVMETFLTLNVPLTTPASFLTHLKCHLYHDSLVSAVPGIVIPAYTALVQQFVMALGQMPDGDWVMKVLSQMPQGALRHVFRLIKEGQASQQEAQRKTCLRLIRDISERVDRPEFEPVRLAYGA
jgi:hypothetical protein